MALSPRKILSVFLFIFYCGIIVDAQLQNITRTVNPVTLPRQRVSVSQQRRGNVAQSGGSTSQQRRVNDAQRGSITSQQFRGNDAQRGSITSQQRRGNDVQRGSIASQQFRGNDAQRGSITSQQRRGNDAQRGSIASQQFRGNDAQRGSIASQQRRGNDLQRGSIASQQFRGNDAQRGSIVSQQRRGNDAQRGSIVSQQRRGNDAQRGSIVSQQRRGNDVQRGSIASQQRRGNDAQRGSITSLQFRGNDAQRGSIASQQRRGNDLQRGGLVQLGRRLPQRRPILNLQNLPRASGIPRARSFQAVLPNTVPRRDPRTGMVSRGMSARSQPTRRMLSGSQLQRQTINRNAMCAPPRSVRCYSWPRNRDPRNAYICDGGCQRRACPVRCECSCVDPRLLGRLRAVGRISGPELTLIDTRLTGGARLQRQRNRILATRAGQQRQLSTQPGTSSNRGIRTNELQQPNTNVDLNFGISDDVLATLIAQPLLNEIVGPQGINQIIAGEPPALLTREDRGQRSVSPSITNEIPQPDIRAIRTSLPRAQQRTELPLQAQDRSMGIPVPLSRINFAPGTEMNPAMGNMRVIMSDIRPFADPTTGMNIDLPSPTPVDMNMPSPADNQVSVRQLPGTSVLFVDLTRPPQSGQSRRMPSQRILTPFNRTTSSDLRSRIGNNVLISNTSQISNQTLPGSFGVGGNVRIDPRIRPPTQNACLAQRMELWCDPQKPWDGTPGLSRWCLLNCRADNCDNQRCACACMDEILFKTKYEQLSLRAP